MPRPIRLFSTWVLLSMALAQPESARASDVRPAGYLERGVVQQTAAGPQFVSDLERGQNDGRYFRFGGSDHQILYGMGTSPWADFFWPNYELAPLVRDTIALSPAGLDHLTRYTEAQGNLEYVGRVGSLAIWGALAAGLGGLAYDLLPGNPRQMQPSFYYATGGVALAGLAAYWASGWSARGNFGALDEAIDAYNRDMAMRHPPAPRSPAR